jgi:hypothetical protein
VDPTHDADLLADIFFTQFSAEVCSFPVSKYVAQKGGSLKIVELSYARIAMASQFRQARIISVHVWSVKRHEFR